MELLVKLTLALLIFAVEAFAGNLPAPLIPNSLYTPGTLCTRLDENYREDRYQEKIPYCKRRVANELKKRIYELYGIPQSCRKQYTIDHFYPLALGGNNQQANLWPEHLAIKRTRQNLEQQLYVQLRDGKITQARALTMIYEEKLRPDTNQIPTGDYCEQFLPKQLL
jgi:hypothetical protein